MNPSDSPAGAAADIAVRRFKAPDWVHVWPIFHEVVSAGDAITYDRGTSEPDARLMWTGPAVARNTVAVDGAGRVLGSAKMGANQGGAGSHVATATFLVSASARGRGVGRTLATDALSWAVDAGFLAMQFNAVVAVNAPATRLWASLGFNVVGVVPHAFRHPGAGLVDLHVMHRFLDTKDE